MEGCKIRAVEGDSRLMANSGPNFLFLLRSRLPLPPRGVFQPLLFFFGLGGGWGGQLYCTITDQYNCKIFKVYLWGFDIHCKRLLSAS